MVWTQAEVGQFIEEGYVVLREGFSRQVADAGRAFIWNEMGLSPGDSSAWTETIVHLQTGFDCHPFTQVLNPRLEDAIEHLMGPGRGVIHGYMGWWPVLFPGFEGPGGWHLDGSTFHHHLTSREQGLVSLFLFSDVGPGDGGTAVARRSHRAVARMLEAAEPGGLAFEELHVRLPRPEPRDIVEITGSAGDVALLHPFLIHGFNENRGESVGFACNPQFPQRAPMELDRSDGDHSPVEEAIRRALGMP